MKPLVLFGSRIIPVHNDTLMISSPLNMLIDGFQTREQNSSLPITVGGLCMTADLLRTLCCAYQETSANRTILRCSAGPLPTLLATLNGLTRPALLKDLLGQLTLPTAWRVIAGAVLATPIHAVWVTVQGAG